MTIHLVTFSDDSMSRSRKFCVESAMRHGVGSAVQIVDSKPCDERGCGYWRWKPQIIHAALTDYSNFQWDYIAAQYPIIDGDILIYADAGVEFINNVNHIIDRIDQDIFLFGNNWEHAHWCKGDVATEVWPPTDREFWLGDWQGWSRFGKQVQASVIFFCVSDYTRQFVKEWLDWCLFEDGRLIDDSPSRALNHPEFREHRHDQAILTTMAYREGIRLHYWPAMYNDGSFTYEKLPEYAGDDYPTLFHHHRRRNHEWEQVA